MLERLSQNELITIVAFVTAAVGFLLFYLARRLEHRRAVHKLEEAVKAELHIPASLHPVIDPDVCIGSGSCIDACPEGKILGLIDGKAQLLNGSKCIGHGKCAAECPVDAIKLVFGSSERGVDLPEVDTHFETSRQGVHIVGELAGMGLIKNALSQGIQVAAHFKQTLGRGGGKTADVAIVGAGPAGLATAVGCKNAGLSYILMEQDSLGGTVAHYPRKKFVMTDTVHLPGYGDFGWPMSKEELIDRFKDVVEKTRIDIHYDTKLQGIEGEDGAFTVATSRGAVNARKVVLAIGRGGTPRKLGVPGEDLAKVAYRLVDPNLYDGKRVLVVGGGDSALEAAIMLGEESSAEVAISYRKPEFGRCRPANKQKIGALIQKGRVQALMGTEITAVDEQSVILKNGSGGPMRLANDGIIACLGGILPTEFLQSVGISIERHQGRKAMANPALMGKQRGQPKDRRRGLFLFALGAAIVAALLYAGLDYYLLPYDLRFRSPLHKAFKPSGIWGHGIGVAASLFMLLNFVYPIRKRLKIFKGRGPIAPWLTFHIFVGLMSPIVILFHSAFVWRNALATTTYVSLVIVVVTGIIGRSIYGLVQTEGVRESLEKMSQRLQPMLGAVAHRGEAWVDAMVEKITTPPDTRGSLVGLFARMPFESMYVRFALRHSRELFLNRSDYREFRDTYVETLRARSRLAFQHRLKRLMDGWRIFHVVLSIMLLLVMAAHIVVSVKLGFRWILK